MVLVDDWPIGHRAFRGNGRNAATVAQVLEDLETRFGLQRVVFLADRGMVTAESPERGHRPLPRPGHRPLDRMPAGADLTPVQALALYKGLTEVERAFRHLRPRGEQRPAGYRRDRGEVAGQQGTSQLRRPGWWKVGTKGSWRLTRRTALARLPVARDSERGTSLRRSDPLPSGIKALSRCFRLLGSSPGFSTIAFGSISQSDGGNGGAVARPPIRIPPGTPGIGGPQ
jgi:hypothetical protein